MADSRDTATDWRKLLPPTSGGERIRRLLTGGAIAALGLFGLNQPAESSVAAPAPTASPALLERGKKTAKLVLTLPGRVSGLVGQHRSHSSHSSHSSHTSHYSGSGGTSSSTTPIVPRTSASTVASTPALEPDVATGLVEKIDREKRTFSLKTVTGIMTYVVRDDTIIEIAAGVTVRLDDYLENHPRSFPFSEQERVRVKWRIAPYSEKLVATNVSPAKP